MGGSELIQSICPSSSCQLAQSWWVVCWHQAWLGNSRQETLGHLPGHTDQEDNGSPEAAAPKVSLHPLLEPGGVAGQAHRSHRQTKHQKGASGMVQLDVNWFGAVS